MGKSESRSRSCIRVCISIPQKHRHIVIAAEDSCASMKLCVVIAELKVGLKSRRKGADGEREIVALTKDLGLHPSREWHLAQSPDLAERACDIQIAGQPYQVKRLRNGFQGLYDGLEHVSGLFLRADGRGWLAVCVQEIS